MAELKVVITDERGGQESEVVNVPNEQSDPTKATNNATPKTPTASKNAKSAQGMAIAAMLASRAFSYATSNVGKYTGNSKLQDTTNNLQQVGSFAAAAYFNPYVAIAALAVKVGTTAINNNYEQKQQTAASNRRMAKAGYSNTGEVVGRRH